MASLSGPVVESRRRKVFVVLGTYNGAQYLPEFAESLRRQSYSGWTMLVRDDASGDTTPAMLREMAAEENRFVVLQDDATRYGPAKNFGRLLQRAYELGAEYVFLADQDDVWLPDKISRQLALMRRSEATAASGTPILAYSDLTVVDSRLRTIHASFFRYTRFYRDDRQPLKTLLAHNFIPGCALAINRALLELTVPLPSAAPVHDWWIALCAASAGRLVFLPEPTVLYRQHGENTYGARGFWAAFNPLRSGWKKRWDRGMEDFARHVEQTNALRCRLQQRGLPCPRETRALLDRYCGLLERPNGAFHRIDQMHQLGIPKAGFFRRLVFYARMLRVNR